MDNKDFDHIPPGKEDRVLKILDRWVIGEISSGQAERELQITGVKLPDQDKEGRE